MTGRHHFLYTNKGVFTAITDSDTRVYGVCVKARLFHSHDHVDVRCAETTSVDEAIQVRVAGRDVFIDNRAGVGNKNTDKSGAV